MLPRLLNTQDVVEVDVRWYGAVSDGVADDTAAVAAARAAVIAAGGGVILFPLGTTMVDADLLDFDGPGDGVSSVTLRGVTRGVGQYASGSVLRARGAGSYLVRFAGQNMHAEHLTLHGGASAAGDPATDAVVFFDYQSIGSGLRDCAVQGGRAAAAVTCTPDHTTDTFTAVAHGLANGDQLYFTTTGGLPAALYNVSGHYNRVWFVVGRTNDTFQISQTSGGAAQAFADNGSGVMSFTKLGGHDWGHLVRIGGASGLQADTGVISNCLIGDLNYRVGRSLFFSDGNALVWRISHTTIVGGIDCVYNRGGSFALDTVNFYPTPSESRAHIVKDGACGTVNIGGASYTEADAVPLIVIVPGQSSDYPASWAVTSMQFLTARAHVHWDCYQPLTLAHMGGSLYVTGSGGHSVTCVGSATEYAADAELGRVYGDTTRVQRFAHRERSGVTATQVRRLSGVPGVYSASANHGKGIFIDGGEPYDDSLRQYGPVVVDLGKYGSGNQTAPLVLARQYAAATVSSVDHTIDQFTSVTHDLGWGDSVLFSTTGTLPGGLIAGIEYFVRPTGANTFEVALERVGDAVSLTSNGTGTLTYRPLREFLAILQDDNSGRPNEVRFSSEHAVAFYAPTLSFGAAGAVTFREGTGSPEGVVTGNVGDVFHRTDGGSGTVLYVKESGTGNTGWATIVGGSGTPATTVVAETSYGQSSAVGVATNYAREDHTHGTPALGTTGTTACAGNDARLSDARTPTTHAHGLADITDEGALASLNTVGTTQIDNAAVTYAKIQDVSAASKLLGRGSAAGSGDAEEITLGTNLSMSGTTLNATGGSGGGPDWFF